MYELVFKRTIDFVVSVILIVILSPVLLIVALLIYRDMGAPIFFTQIRSGKSKQGFRIYKFRTMRDGAEGDSDKDRITRLGNTLRRWSLDELPQLFNVVKGDMSLVGPRPLLPEYDAHYSDEQNKRFLVNPGVTGLAQVEGRNDLQWNEKFALDIAYVNSLSALNDIKILVRTVYVVFGAKGFRKSGEEKKFSDL
ncbi:MAG: sugar transferase [Sedimenticola sp.]